MTMSETFSGLSDPFDLLVAELEFEYGKGASRIMAERLVEAEEADFCWRARRGERLLPPYRSALEEDSCQLNKIAILGFLQGHWFAAICLVGEGGQVVDLLWRRWMAGRKEAARAFDAAR